MSLALRLRERGVYALPNGKQLIACVGIQGGYLLYDRQGWNKYELPEYEINEAGRVFCAGKLTAWRMEDLRDTGQTIT